MRASRSWVVPMLCMLVAGCAGGVVGAPSLPDATTRRIEAAVVDEMKSGDLPSVAVLVDIADTGRYVGAFGPRQRSDTGGSDGTDARATTDAFRIASITKTFVGTVVLQLADDGALRLTDTLATWYPTFPRATEISITDLLRMRSGIPDSIGDAFLPEYYAHPRTTLTAEDMIARAAAEPASAFVAPDTRTVYTNVNFALLERIVEKVTGQDIRTVLTARVLGPLRLAHTVYPRGPVLDSPLHGYSFEPDRGRFADRTVLSPSPAGGAGAMVSTLDDLRVHARALCRGTLLKPQTQRGRLVSTAFEGQSARVEYGERSRGWGASADTTERSSVSAPTCGICPSARP